jgi:hypothetical protein
MNRRVAIIVLCVVLTLLALTLASFAAGRAGTPAGGVPRPSMSGEFAHTHFACAGTHFAPSIYIPTDNWRLRTWPRVPHPYGTGAHGTRFV